MLNGNRDKLKQAAGTFEHTLSPVKSYKEGFHPLELYVKGDRGYRADVLYNHVNVIWFLYVYEDALTKAFLVKQYTDFTTGSRTTTAVSGSCFKYTPFRMYDKKILADVLLFSSDKVDELFPSTFVGDFLTKDTTLASAGKYPKLPGKMEKFRSKARISSMPWLLPLVSGNKVIEGLISDDNVMKSLYDYHIAAGCWGQDMYNLYMAKEQFLDGRGTCPIPVTLDKVPLHQNQYFPLEVIFTTTKKSMNTEARSLEERVDQFRSSNE